jgi:hypothetical protein
MKSFPLAARRQLTTRLLETRSLDGTSNRNPQQSRSRTHPSVSTEVYPSEDWYGGEHRYTKEWRLKARHGETYALKAAK